MEERERESGWKKGVGDRAVQVLVGFGVDSGLMYLYETQWRCRVRGARAPPFGSDGQVQDEGHEDSRKS